MSWSEASYIIDELKDATASEISALGGGVAPGLCRTLYAVTDDDDETVVHLRWKDPSDTYIDGQLITTWASTTVVRKKGSYPESITDGTTVVVNTERDLYNSRTNTYDDQLASGESGNDWYYMAFPASDGGAVSTNTKNRFYQGYEIYGFMIDKGDSNPATRVHYIAGCANEDFTPAYMDYDAGAFNYGDWDEDLIWFLADNYPAMVGYDGVEDYKLYPSDYTLREDGVTASDVSDSSYAGNCMVKIPLVWLYQYEDDDYQYCYVSPVQVDDNYHAYAHTRSDGTIMDYIWLSAFEGASVSSVLRSIKGLTPINTQTGTTEITYATANGSLWYTGTWAQRNLINMLLILMGRSTDSQTTFGNGYYTDGSSSSLNRLTTGYGSGKGRFYGSTATRDVVKVFHIENWWGDMWERIAGCMTDTNKQIIVKMTPPYNTTGDGYVSTGVTPSGTSGGYISASAMSEYGLVPSVASGSSTTYEADGLCWAASCYAIAGGSCSDGLFCGASALNVLNAVSASSWNICAALSCEQPSSSEAA